MEPVRILKKEKDLLLRLGDLRERIYTPIAPLHTEFAPSPEPVPWEVHEELHYRPLPPKGKWADVFGCAWFRLRGAVSGAYASEHVVAHVDIGGEGLVYTPGSKMPIGAVAMDASYIDRLQACTAKTILPVFGTAVAYDIDAGFNGYYNRPVGHAYFRCAELCICDDGMLQFYYDFLTAAFRLCCTHDAKRREAIQGVLEKAYQIGRFNPAQGRLALNNLPEIGEDIIFTAEGHSHLDLAWLWPLRETKRKACRTFVHQIGNLERYPSYIYGASQPQQFHFVKESHPALYRKLQEMAGEGRLECQGAMWVEADANLPSGEALIRQILYGKRFFREEFGQEPEICWLPDTFGFNGNLPQILHKSGVPYFLTTKLSWNEHNPFPYRSFTWEGIDGSRVLAHMPPGDTYNAAASPADAAFAAANYPERDRSPRALMLYGIGDGGGGPGEAHLEMLLRQKNLRPGTSQAFFSQLRHEQEKLPLYKGELYLEKHQGTYTTQGFHKWANRRCELGLQSLEALSVWASTRGGVYPKDELERLWKRVLLLQFHDILSGSSIERVYVESRREYVSILTELRRMQRAALADVSENVRGVVSAYNPSPFSREVFLKRRGQWFAGSLPPLGSALLSSWTGTAPLENRLEVRFAEDGTVCSLMDRETGFEYAGAFLNRLTLYEDPFLPYNAWDIDETYEMRPYEVLRPERIETVEDGPLLIRRHFFRHGETTLRQEIFSDPIYPVLYFRTSCHWAERLKMLRADFAPAVFADQVTCDIQMGAIRRSTREEDPRERAQFEVCAHKYVDVSDGSHGLSLLNDGKYGHRVKNGRISLNLLRSTILPDPRAEKGTHVFTYALLLHNGVCGAETVRQSYFLNQVPVFVDGRLAPWSAATVFPETVVVETVKQAEDGQGIILRLYEAVGRETEAAVMPGFSFRAVYECDLEENILAPVDEKRLLFRPFEIKTLCFQ